MGGVPGGSAEGCTVAARVALPASRTAGLCRARPNRVQPGEQVGPGPGPARIIRPHERHPARHRAHPNRGRVHRTGRAHQLRRAPHRPSTHDDESHVPFPGSHQARPRIGAALIDHDEITQPAGHETAHRQLPGRAGRHREPGDHLDEVGVGQAPLRRVGSSRATFSSPSRLFVPDGPQSVPSATGSRPRGSRHVAVSRSATGSRTATTPPTRTGPRC